MAMTRRRGAPLLLVAATVAFALGSPAAAAEMEARSWEAGAFVVSTTFDNDTLMSDSFGFGVRGGFFGSPRHGGEFVFISQSADDAARGSDRTIDITRYSINYLYNLKVKKPESKLLPFVRLGAGTMSYDSGGVSDSTSTLQIGGGVRVFLSKRFALRFDGAIWHLHGDNVIIPRDGYFAFDLTAGVSYVFGGGA